MAVRPNARPIRTWKLNRLVSRFIGVAGDLDSITVYRNPRVPSRKMRRYYEACPSMLNRLRMTSGTLPPICPPMPQPTPEPSAPVAICGLNNRLPEWQGADKTVATWNLILLVAGAYGISPALRSRSQHRHTTCETSVLKDAGPPAFRVPSGVSILKPSCAVGVST